MCAGIFRFSIPTWFAGLALAGLVASAVTAQAPVTHGRLELRWRAPKGCPGTRWLHAALARAMPPLAAPIRIKGTIVRVPGGYRLVLLTRQEQTRGRRVLKGASCAELARATVVFVSLLAEGKREPPSTQETAPKARGREQQMVGPPGDPADESTHVRSPDWAPAELRERTPLGQATDSTRRPGGATAGQPAPETQSETGLDPAESEKKEGASRDEGRETQPQDQTPKDESRAGESADRRPPVATEATERPPPQGVDISSTAWAAQRFSGEEEPDGAQPLQIALGLGAAVAGGVTPRPMLGPQALMTLDWGSFAFELDAVWLLPRVTYLANPNDAGSRTQLVRVGANGCANPVHGDWSLALCGGLETGMFWSRAVGVTSPQNALPPWLAPRVAIELRAPILGPLRMILHTEASAPLVRPYFTIEDLPLDRDTAVFRPATIAWTGYAVVAWSL